MKLIIYTSSGDTQKGMFSCDVSQTKCRFSFTFFVQLKVQGTVILFCLNLSMVF